MSFETADRHNFGQQVKPTDGASCVGAPRVFHKPRTVFWEWLFFGKTSPLQPLFAVPGKNSGLIVSEAFFNLDVSVESQWSGTSKEVIADESIGQLGYEKNLDLFIRFGMLLGYAYVFGIRDLHRANVIRTKTNLQVIDAEVVLTDLILPHETLLMPFKDVKWKDCGLSHLAESAEQITEAQASAIMSGYIDVLTVIDEKKDEILAVMSDQDLSHPIRIILRNTKEYTAMLNEGTSRETLMDGEQAQLDRGDIPYFFKRQGSNDVHWVTSVGEGGTHEFAKLTSAPSYESDINRHACSPLVLLAVDSKDIIEVRRSRGIAYIKKNLKL